MIEAENRSNFDVFHIDGEAFVTLGGAPILRVLSVDKDIPLRKNHIAMAEADPKHITPVSLAYAIADVLESWFPRYNG